MIAQRQEKSVFWKVVHFFGSLKLAIALLAIIAIACAVATLYESKFNTRIAQVYIYKAPWFLFWLALLCVNLFAVTMTRWPWQKKHTGFIVTHYGIITLLIGSMIGMHTGFEGNVTLDKTAAPVSRIVTNKSIVQIQSPVTDGLYLMPFDGEARRPSESRPVVFEVPETKLRIVADAYAPRTQRTPTLVADPAGSPGVILEMASAMAAQTVSVPLGAGGERTHDFFGLAKMELVNALPEREAGGQRETRLVFAKFAPVSHGGATSPMTVVLSEDGESVTIQDASGAGAVYSRAEIVGKSLMTPSGAVRVEAYWPDFVMKNGEPTTASNEPKNPAIVVLLDVPAAGGQTAGSLPLLEVVPDAEGDAISYMLSRNGASVGSGKSKVGETFAVGWADWTAKVTGVSALARVQEVVTPEMEAVESAGPGVPGIRVRLEDADGGQSPAVWLESGSVVPLTVGGQTVRMGYGLETRPTAFSIRLLDFQVPRDEGTEQPADFIASVQFQDHKTRETKDRTLRMNHPASFPGEWWNLVTGLNYKFSQAEWNPRNLGETTLQVLYDPGWMLKWMGSLGICIGIAIMFYWKPTASKS